MRPIVLTHAALRGLFRDLADAPGHALPSPDAVLPGGAPPLLPPMAPLIQVTGVLCWMYPGWGDSGWVLFNSESLVDAPMHVRYVGAPSSSLVATLVGVATRHSASSPVCFAVVEVRDGQFPSAAQERQLRQMATIREAHLHAHLQGFPAVQLLHAERAVETAAHAQCLLALSMATKEGVQ